MGAIFFAVATRAFALDPYDVLEKVGAREHIPRLLSTEDADMAARAPEELQPIEGDFDKDGKTDIAIAGVYNLPKKSGAYFLLVAGGATERAPRVLMAKDGRTPFYLHKAGSTGAGDPGDQAFSVTTCVNCSTGTDVRWDARARKLRSIPWRGERITHVTVVPVAPQPSANVPENAADEALKVAGRLKDVQDYVAELKAGGGTLGTRVEPVTGTTKRVRVLVFEKLEKGEKLYDAIEVDLASGKVVKRKRT